MLRPGGAVELAAARDAGTYVARPDLRAAPVSGCLFCGSQPNRWMTKVHWIALWLMVGLGGLAYGCYQAVGGFGDALAGICGTDQRSAITSPDRRHRAVVYLAGCGAAGDTWQEVSILPADEALTDTTRFNVARTSYLGEIRTSWTSADTLVVQMPSWTSTSESSSEVARDVVNGIRIHYRDTTETRAEVP